MNECLSGFVRNPDESEAPVIEPAHHSSLQSSSSCKSPDLSRYWTLLANLNFEADSCAGPKQKRRYQSGLVHEHHC